MKYRCLKCGGELLIMDKEILKSKNFICKKCHESYNEEELKVRCCD